MPRVVFTGVDLVDWGVVLSCCFHMVKIEDKRKTTCILNSKALKLRRNYRLDPIFIHAKYAFREQQKIMTYLSISR